MRSRLALLVAPLLLLSLFPATVAAGGPSADRARHEAVMAFWTPARLAAAIPRDITFDPVRGFVPNAGKPGGGGGGGGGTGVLGVSWTDGGVVTKAVGKVFFVMGAFYYQCSGSVVQDTRTNESLVLTAGHCVIDKGKFATNWIFIPSYESNTSISYTGCSGAPDNACYSAKALVVDKSFADQKRFNTTAVLNDFAFAVLDKGTNSQTLEGATGGAYGITFTPDLAGRTLSAFGYPAAAPYDGKHLTYCQGPVGTDANMNNQTWSMACKMTGGSSGGGWLDGDPKVYSATLSSLNSYGYSGVDYMYGPKFNTSTKAVYDAANGTLTTNTIVPVP